MVFPLNCWSSKNPRFPLFRKLQAKRSCLSKYPQSLLFITAQRGSDGSQHPGSQPRGNLQSLHLRLGRRHLLFLLPRGSQRADFGAVGEHRIGHVVRERLCNILRSVQERRAEPRRAAALVQRGQPIDSGSGDGLASFTDLLIAVDQSHQRRRHLQLRLSSFAGCRRNDRRDGLDIE